MSIVSPGGFIGAGRDKQWLSQQTPNSPTTPLTPATLVNGAYGNSEKFNSAFLAPPDAEIKSRIYALGYDSEHGEYQRQVPLNKEQAKLSKLRLKELKLVENGRAPPRKMKLLAPIYMGAAAGLSIFFVTKGIREYRP